MSVHDYAGQREAGAGPGADTRQWISNGVVNADAPGAPSVDFSNKSGPLVSVRLHPSDIDVRCRVASFVAGLGEGEWHPFAGGDEVLVAFPLGSERGGAIIVGRLNNGVDTFPTNIANLDVTGNNVTTRCNITNFAWEISNGWILRSSTTGAQFALNTSGDWILNSGDLHFLSLSSSGVSLSLAKMSSYMSIDASSGVLTLNVGPGKAMLVMEPTNGFIFASTLGGQPVGRVATVEGAVGLVSSALTTFGITAVASSVFAAALLSALVPLVTALSTVTSMTVAALNGPASTLLSLLSGALQADIPIAPSTTASAVLAAIPQAGLTPAYATFSTAVGAALAKPRSPDGITAPGLGCPGFMV
jgi:hypothetical protein